MGKTSRKKPARLAEKLTQIRIFYDLSQNQLIARIGFQEELQRETISNFERGVREPSLLVLLAYARLANISVESLIDDKIDLAITKNTK